MLKIILGLWAGWLAVRIMRGVIGARLAAKGDNSRLDPQQSNATTLELMPCPGCGVFTSTPCTNPDCKK